MTRFLTAPIMYALLALTLGALIFGGVQCSGKKTAEVALANAQKTLSDERAAVATERQKFIQWARDQEHRHAADMARIDADNQKRIANEKAANDRLVADLRAGNVRLHARWSAAVATAKLSQGVAAAGRPDAAERERQDSAARIIGAADRCDAQVKGLQDVVRSMMSIGAGEPSR